MIIYHDQKQLLNEVQPRIRNQKMKTVVPKIYLNNTENSYFMKNKTICQF